MAVALVVAVSENGVIGAGGDLPWHLPRDLAHFRSLTVGHTVVMGRRTWDSIGRPLIDRRNIVVTRNADLAATGAEIVTDVAEALAAVDEDSIFVIGGGELYAHALPVATRVHLTRVHATIDGDTHFEDLPADQWELVSSEQYGADGSHAHAMTFETWERRAEEA